MYYPQSQIITGLYTSGNEFSFLNARSSYQGYYYQTSDGKYFSNKSPNDTPTSQLFPTDTRSNNTSSITPISPTKKGNNNYYLIKGIYSVIPEPNNISPAPPSQISPLPTEEEYKLGEFNRYFAYKSSTNQTTEVTKFEYNQFLAKDPNLQVELYTPVTVKWVLRGTKENVYKANSNLVKLKETRENVPGFSKYFKGKYDQYYRFSKNENLYSDGKELKYSKSKKPYIGYYHIHPTKGPMVGRQHIMEAHDYLEFTSTGSILNPLPPTIQSGSYEEPSKTITNTFGGY
tara:strand:+ start:184 stop:1047 length:864 start_codon:yes stop_codon:yes gene_type:complete